MNIKQMNLEVEDLIYELNITNNAMGNEVELLNDCETLISSLNELSIIFNNIILNSKN